MPYLAVEVAADRLISAIAEESALTDRDLDAIERRISDARSDTSEIAALALTLGRAGRAESAGTLADAKQRLQKEGRALEASVVALAIELLSPVPPSFLERGERGYRRRDPTSGEELFVEDPLAAHWHLRGRVGPPIRTEPDAPHVFAGPGSDLDALAGRVREGEVVVVTFAPRGSTPRAPLRVFAAGLSRDPKLGLIVRWPSIQSIGVVERKGRWPFERFSRREPRVGYEVAGHPVSILPERPSMSVPALVSFLTMLLKAGRS